VLPFGRVAHIPRDEWPRRAVGECMLPPNALPVLSEDDHLFDALAALSEAARSRGAVLPDGPLVGLLSLTDIEARARRKQTLRKARRAGRGRSSRGREHIAVARA
jgi:CBS domain-containing protein